MEKIQQLHAALMDAYKIEEMEQLLRYDLDINMPSIAAPTANQSRQFYQIIEWANRSGKLSRLVYAAYCKRPNNAMMKEFFERHALINFASGSNQVMQDFDYDSSDQRTEQRVPLNERVRELEIRLKMISNELIEIKEMLKSSLGNSSQSASIYWRLFLFILGALVLLAALANVAASWGWLGA